MYFILFIGAVIIFVLIFDLRARMGRLERLLKQKPHLYTEEKTSSAPSAASQIGHPQLSDSVLAKIQPIESGDTWVYKFAVWLKEDWLLKVGAFLLLIGFGWLATYAFLNNWIGPMGRIALGIIAGALILVLGWWRIRKYLNQGGVFIVLGSTTILLTIFAAREIYGFFTPLSALFSSCFLAPPLWRWRVSNTTAELCRFQV